MARDKITIIDFGGQYAHLIANRIRRLGVYTEIVSNDVNPEQLEDSKGIILSGGPQSVDSEGSPQIDQKIFDLGKPMLGICYGHQLFAYNFGGEIGRAPEYGKCKLFINDKSSIFNGCDNEDFVWQNHGDAVIGLPEGFVAMAFTKDNEISSMRHSEKNWFSVQFHPEVTHSGDIGKNIFKNFAINICQATPSWTMEGYLKDLRQEIMDYVGNRNVFLLVSGGVDSTVCFALLNDILGSERVFGLHIDTGFMRKNESQEVIQMLKERGFDNLEVFDASDMFMENLKGVFDPEEKRKIIGKTYLDVKDAALKKYDLDESKWLLAQGTIYPDTVESGGTKHADTIKTHHNRVDQIQALIEKGLIIEPIKELYKDEVREVGRLLGLSPNLVDRHPFPGPGLAIRGLCSKQKEAFIDRDSIYDNGYKIDVLNIKSVGIKGDARSYAHPGVISGEYNFGVLQDVMTKITNSNPDINRLIYNVQNINMDNCKLNEQYLTHEYMDDLRNADSIVTEILQENNLMNPIWQCPVVILPLGCEDKPFSIIVRPVDSIDAMSAKAYEFNWDVLSKISTDITKKISSIFAVFYDITSKPPGTIEWE